MTGMHDIDQLRKLLLGKDYDFLNQLHQQFDTSEHYSQSVSDVISEALKLRAQQDDSLSVVLAPTVEHALTQSIYDNPKRLADVLYPVMGPAIRKSIHETLSEALHNFNQLLEQSFSFKALRWRFDAWRTGKSYSEIALMHSLVYQVEQIFLIHADTSLLLAHCTAPNAVTQDPDMVSGMLSAIQDFIADSFEVSSEDRLSTLNLGELTVLIEHAPYVNLAAVVRGTVPSELRTQLIQTLENIQAHYARTLEHYDGNTQSVAGIDAWLHPCLTQQKHQPSARKPWLAYSVFALLFGIMAYMGYTYYQQQRTQERFLNAVNALDGIIVLHHETNASGLHITGLKDPLAADPIQTLPAELIDAVHPTFEFKPYIAMDDAMVLAHAKQRLTPPTDVQLSISNGTLNVRGTADTNWVKQLNTNWGYIEGITALNTESLTETGSIESTIKHLIQTVHNTHYPFEANKADINAQSPSVQQLKKTLLELLKLTRQTQQVLQIKLIGNTDTAGNAELNSTLALQRAENMRTILINEGIPAAILVVYGSGQHGIPTTEKKNERSVHYQVDLF